MHGRDEGYIIGSMCGNVGVCMGGREGAWAGRKVHGRERGFMGGREIAWEGWWVHGRDEGVWEGGFMGGMEY